MIRLWRVAVMIDGQFSGYVESPPGRRADGNTELEAYPYYVSRSYSEAARMRGYMQNCVPEKQMASVQYATDSFSPEDPT